MKTDLEITPEELAPKLPRVMAPAPARLGELESLLTELRQINHAVNSILPRIHVAINLAIDAVADVKMSDILEVTARHFSVSAADILSKRRPAHTVRPRQIAMFLCKHMTLRSYSEIGLFFRDRDHSTIMHSLKVIEELRTKDEKIANVIDVLSKQIKDKRNV